MLRPFFPFLQVSRGRTESAGSALRLYRFPRLEFDLALRLEWRYPRICIAICD
jgi:hypothetical protein